MNPLTVRLYAATIATAKIGTGFFFLINTWLIIDITGRPSSAAITLVMTILPSLLLSPIIGLAVDRGWPARLAYRAELLRWLVLIAYGALYGTGHATEGIGYAVSFLIALGNEIQVLSWRAALIRAVPSDQMLRLNALTSVGGQSGQILGAAASGIVLAAIGPVATVTLASTTYLAAALLGFLVSRRLASQDPPRDGLERGPRRHLRDLRAGLGHIAQRPEIAFFYGLILANLTVIFSINGMLAPFVREELNLGAEAFGKIDAGYAAGAIASGLLIARLAKRFGQRRILLLGFTAMATSLIAFANCQSLAAAFVTYVGLGISFQTSVLALSLAQQATDPAFQGRVNATFNMLNGLAGLIIYAIVALSAGHHLYRQLYLAQACIVLAIVPILLVAGRRGRIGRLLTPSTPSPTLAQELPAS
ncbi:MAG TPA: MFS transporter [Aliidongia sp.]|uniref:MFS transporter n=1 Tax=Aliidongia sp. TaxID=1914230 RepID=UPI002DDD5955|nr:MFS transporter [Aliidongia sp.]HEV2677743.1 MFS transporter [Aliidongia sp.]